MFFPLNFMHGPLESLLNKKKNSSTKIYVNEEESSVLFWYAFFLGSAVGFRVFGQPLQRDVNVLLVLARDRVAANLSVLNSRQVPVIK
jgi:hypothetical protein